MKKTLFFLLIISGLVTIVSGVGVAAPGHEGSAGHHAAAAGIFVILCLVHLWTNRRAVAMHFRGKRPAAR
jgi:ABC-type transport system involved in cytochrome bd biosynthesis fused ATPase/permease subunit